MARILLCYAMAVCLNLMVQFALHRTGDAVNLMGLLRKFEAGPDHSPLHRIDTYLSDSRYAMVPVMLRELCALYGNPATQPSDFLHLNSISPTSCMHLLVLANTIFYGPLGRKSIQTTPEAVERVGLCKAREAVASAVVATLFRVRRSVSSFSSGSLWLNSVGVAIGTRVVHSALWPGEIAPVDPYLAGLLHNVGIPIAFEVLSPDGYDKAVAGSGPATDRLVDREARAVNITHPEIGAHLMERWKLCPELRELVRRHHEEHMPSGAAGRLAHCLRAAQAMMLDMEVGYVDFPVSAMPLYLQSLNELQIDADRYAVLARQTADELAQFKALGWFSKIRN